MWRAVELTEAVLWNWKRQTGEKTIRGQRQSSEEIQSNGWRLRIKNQGWVIKIRRRYSNGSRRNAW